MTQYSTTARYWLVHIARNVFYAGFLETFPAQTAGVAASAGQFRVRGPIAGYGLGIVHPQLPQGPKPHWSLLPPMPRL